MFLNMKLRHASIIDKKISSFARAVMEILNFFFGAWLLAHPVFVLNTILDEFHLKYILLYVNFFQTLKKDLMMIRKLLMKHFLNEDFQLMLKMNKHRNQHIFHLDCKKLLNSKWELFIGYVNKFSFFHIWWIIWGIVSFIIHYQLMLHRFQLINQIQILILNIIFQNNINKNNQKK